MERILRYEFWRNTLLNYSSSLLLILAGFIIIKSFKGFILKRLQIWAEKTKTTLDDFIIETVKDTLLPLAYFGIFYLGINILSLNPTFKKLMDILGTAILTIFITRLIITLISYGFKVHLQKRARDLALEKSLKGILNVIRIVIWGLAIVFLLDNLGFKITSVIAGLGIGGVAVALAGQTILKDFFSYFSIIFDRPFEVGDFIIIGDYLGTVEYIGIKTTRIRSLGGEQLIFSNSDLTDSRVRNYKRMEKRRVVFKLGVVYQTPIEKLKEIPNIVKEIIKNINDAIFDRAHFFSYGDFSLIFEVVYYVMGADYNKYMDIQQEINFKIKEEFEKRKIEFAFPTSVVYLAKSG